MSNGRHFWRNVALIGLAHVVAVMGLFRWSASAHNAKSENIVWVTGDSAGADAGSSGHPTTAAASTPLPQAAEPTATPVENADEPEPILASAKSEIELPAATPTVTPTPVIKPAATPLVKAPPKPSPRPPRKPRPKPTPRPTPKPTPKPKPPRKTVLAKASPRPSPAESDEAEHDAANADASSTPAAEKNRTPDNDAEKSGNPTGTNSNGAGSGSGDGQGKGTARSSELAAYSRMLHDRLYSEWDQPTSTVSAAAKISTLVRVRIEKDGTISKFEIIKPSGNVMIDESVGAIGKRVSQVDPLPPSLRRSGHYDVKINFELNSE